MSHFITYVFQKSRDYEELLAPYDENRASAPFIKYTREQAIKAVRDEIEDYNNTTYAEYLNNPAKYAEKHPSQVHLDYLKHEFPKRLKWTDEECYEDKKEYFDDDMVDAEGNLWAVYNPDAKWDWYSKGGRWDGILVTKDGKKVNEAKVSEIDFDRTDIPFAFIDPIGRWFEEGEMGWWGVVTDRKDRGDWERCYKEFIETLDGGVTVTAVDCHI